MTGPLHDIRFGIYFHRPDPVWGTWARRFDVYLDLNRYRDFARTAARPGLKAAPVGKGWPRLAEF